MTDTTTPPRTAGRVDDALLLILLENKSPTEAAAALGVSVSTVYRRLRDGEFRARLTEARANERRPHLAQLAGQVSASIGRLVAIRDDEAAPTMARLKACDALLDWFMRFSEHVEVLPRLAALEAALPGPAADPTNTTTDL